MTEQQTAIHEAGHAVMACRCGPKLSSVSIVRDDQEGIAGFVRGPEASQVASPQEAADRVLFILGGYAACIAAGVPAKGCNTDFNDANWLLMQWDLGSLDDWKSRAVEMMRLPSNKAAVRLVVERLIEAGEIEFDAVKACVVQADGDVE